jgi:hypothetical protein
MTKKPTSTTALEPTEIAATQTIIRADNGDVIVADETGLRMRLSDRVIEDIATRLGKLGHSFGHMHRHGDPQNSLGDGDPSSQAEELSYVIGENIDCWAVQQRREFASFMHECIVNDLDVMGNCGQTSGRDPVKLGSES